MEDRAHHSILETLEDFTEKINLCQLLKDEQDLT